MGRNHRCRACTKPQVLSYSGMLNTPFSLGEGYSLLEVFDEYFAPVSPFSQKLLVV